MSESLKSRFYSFRNQYRELLRSDPRIRNRLLAILILLGLLISKILPSPSSDDLSAIVTLSPLLELSPEFGSDDKRTVKYAFCLFSSVSLEILLT